jgi:hypothetical protein
MANNTSGRKISSLSLLFGKPQQRTFFSAIIWYEWKYFPISIRLSLYLNYSSFHLSLSLFMLKLLCTCTNTYKSTRVAAQGILVFWKPMCLCFINSLWKLFHNYATHSLQLELYLYTIQKTLFTLTVWSCDAVGLTTSHFTQIKIFFTSKI